MYKVIKLSTFDGKAYIWMSRQQKSWEAMFERAFGADQIVWSTFVSEHHKIKAGKPFEERCLQDTSCSLMGLFMLLPDGRGAPSVMVASVRRAAQRQQKCC